MYSFFNRMPCVCAILLLTGALASLGCTRYKKKIAHQEDEIAKLRVENAELTADKEELASSNSDLEKEIADLQARIAALLEYQKGLETQLEELGVDRSKLAEQFEAAQANLASQQKMIQAMKRTHAQAQRRLRTLKNMLQKFKSLIEGGKLNVRIRDGKLMLELPSAVLFELGEAKLSDDGKQTLTEVAGVLAHIRDQEFQVAGHTDNVPITSGRFPSNWELSTTRALTVVKFLQKNGVRPTVLSAAGYSEYRPAVPNTTKEQRDLNRRIEITLMPNLDELPDLSELEKELTLLRLKGEGFGCD